MAWRNAVGISATLVLALLILAFVPRQCVADNAPVHTNELTTLYDSNPNHLLNRLHRALFVRTDAAGKEYGWDQLDPLYWHQTKHLLDEGSHQNAVKVLDEFIGAGDAAVPKDRLKRAMLQRDLWALFDWTASAYRDQQHPERDEAKRRLQKRLAVVMRELALTRNEINQLPDNYAAAVKSHAYPKEFDTSKPMTPFLPSDLLTTNSSWVGLSTSGRDPLAVAHVGNFGGRSVFQVLIQVPGGRQKTLDYVRQLAEFPQPWIYKVDTNVWISSDGHATSNKTYVAFDENLPQFPDGTMFALVRRTFLIDKTGELIVSPLIESVQLRRYNDVHAKPVAYGQTKPEAQSVFEFVLSKQQLFNAISGGLRAVSPNEKEFRQFMSKGFDPFEEGRAMESKPALDCHQCHGAPGLHSVNSIAQIGSHRDAYLPLLSDTTEHAVQAVIQWKKQQFSWGLLQGMWR